VLACRREDHEAAQRRSIGDAALTLCGSQGILHSLNALFSGAANRPIHHQGDLMKKLTLDFGALAVESFQVDTQALSEALATCRCSKCNCTYTCPI
jgi:hypothetical protein